MHYLQLYFSVANMNITFAVLYYFTATAFVFLCPDLHLLSLIAVFVAFF